jgi:hypothetical protein
MVRLWLILSALAAIFFYAAGCTRSALEAPSDGGTDGGGKDCRQLDEKGCVAAGTACVADYCFACSCTPSFAGCRPSSPGDTPPMCPQYGCPQPICSCDGLPEGACIAEEQSLGCTPSYCPDCRGGQVFVSCLGPNAGSGVCPASCPIEVCHNDGECSPGEFCLAPGESPGCGACKTGTECTGDGSCAAGEICGFDPCVCTNSGMGCIPGCNQTGCPEGQTCGNSNHCLPQWCQKPNDCPAQFECSSNQCQRKLCNDDSMCPGGYCVKNQCYFMIGHCATPPP